MADQPVADVILKEADAVRKVVVAEVLLMMQETLVILVEREDVEAVANLVAAEITQPGGYRRLAPVLPEQRQREVQGRGAKLRGRRLGSSQT